MDAAAPSSTSWSRAPATSSRRRASGGGPPEREPAQHEPGQLDLALGRGHRPDDVQPHPAAVGGHRVQRAVERHQLHQQVVAEAVQDLAGRLPVVRRAGAARRAPGARPDGALQPAPVLLQPADGGPGGARGVEPAHDVAQGREVGDLVPVVRRARRRGRERAGTPSLAPDQQHPGVTAGDRVALTDRGELGAVRRRVRSQLHRAQPILVSGRREEPTPAGGKRGGGGATGLGAQRLGEPAGRVAERGAAAAEPRRASQVAVGVAEPAGGRGEAPGQQVRGGRLLGAERVEPVGDPAGLRAQPAVAHAGVVPRLHEHEGRASLPPRPPLGAEQVAGGGGAVGGHLLAARGLRGPGGREQQLRPLRRFTGVLLDAGVCLGERLPGEARGQQHLAAVEDQVGRVHPERGVPLGGIVEKAERRRRSGASGDDIRRGAALEEDGAEGVHAEHAHRLARLVGGAAEVRHEEHVLEPEQSRVNFRFVLEDVERGAGDLAAVECGDERLLVHDRSAGGVHEQPVPPHRTRARALR